MGELIDVERAEQVLFDAVRRIRDAWLAWPSRIGPLIAADMDRPADLIVEALTKLVYQQLAELGEQEGEFAEEAA